MFLLGFSSCNSFLSILLFQIFCHFCFCQYYVIVLAHLSSHTHRIVSFTTVHLICCYGSTRIISIHSVLNAHPSSIYTNFSGFVLKTKIFVSLFSDCTECTSALCAHISCYNHWSGSQICNIICVAGFVGLHLLTILLFSASSPGSNTLNFSLLPLYPPCLLFQI